jgi:hypothetical protein
MHWRSYSDLQGGDKGNLYLVERDAASVKSLFSNFSSMDNPIVKEFISRIPETFTECLTSLSPIISSSIHSENRAIIANRTKLESSIRQFHLLGQTLSDEVENALIRLRDPSSYIFVSVHQPNLFPYSGVFKKIVLAQTLKDKLQVGKQKNKIVNLFIVIDHDFMDETWIHLAQLPSIENSGGILELRYPVFNSERWRMIFKNPVPSSGILFRWREQILTWIKNSTPKSGRTQALQNFAKFWSYVEESHKNSKSFADFSSFIMSKLVNNEWNYDTLFVKLSDISQVLQEGFTFLLNNFKTYSSALREAESVLSRNKISNTGVSPNVYLLSPLWIHCTCGSKGSSVIRAHDKHNTSLIGKCISCRKGLAVSLGSSNDIAIKGEDLSKLSPRAIPILILLSRELGSTCYISGTGGTSYAVYSSFAYNRLSLKSPLFIFWPSIEKYDGFAQRQAMKAARVSDRLSLTKNETRLSLMHIEYFKKIRPLLKEREDKIGSEKELQLLLSQLFELKQKQREVRRSLKVTKKAVIALNLRPCIIDYIVNFGSNGIETCWRNDLEHNDFLASEILWK